MTFFRFILITSFLFTNDLLFAQTTDTLLHVDSTQAAPVIADTVINMVRDTTPQQKTVAATPGYIINGKVEDANTGEGIPFATVFFPGTGTGLAADLSGNFVLKVDKLPSDTLRIQAIGYKLVTKILSPAQHDVNFILELERANAALKEVVIHAGEDPAVVLMRHVIARKPFNNPDRTENYKYEAYNRLEADLERLSRSQFQKIPILKSYSFVFNDLDTVSETTPYLPLYLTETISDYYFRRHPKKQREFIKASMVKGVNNENVVKWLGTLHQNINIYKNYLPVFDKKFVSPISDEGLFYYKYSIRDTQQAYGHNIILVQFRPRREGEGCFVGDFWVVDSVYAIQRMSMDVSKLANINWVNKISLYQEFVPVDSFWFPCKDKFIANFTAYNSNKLPGMVGRKTTTYHHIIINNPAVDSVLSDPRWKTEVVKEDSVSKKSDQWWDTNRPDTLTKNERAIHKMVDTINKMPITRVYKNLIMFAASGVIDVGPIQLGPYFYVYSTNPVEGNRFRLSLGTPRKLKDEHFTGFVAYGTQDQRFKYGATGLWIMNRSPWTTLYGYYIHDINQATNYYDQLGSDNIFSALFRKPGIPWKLAFSDDQRLEFYKEFFSGFSNKFIIQHRDFTPYAPLPSVVIFHDVKGSPSNDVVSSEAGVEFRYAYKESFLEGQYYRLDVGSKYPILLLSFTAGFKNVLNSAYQYQKLRFSIRENINIPPFGHLYYNLFAGKYFGTLPYPLLEIHPGNEYLYYNQYAFEMMNNYEFVSDQYAGFNIEHNIGGGIFNHIPLMKRLKWRQFWTAKGLIGSLSDANQQLNQVGVPGAYPFRTLRGDPYLELGTGIDNIFHIFRIDVDWRVAPAPLPEESKEKYFGVFGSVRFQF